MAQPLEILTLTTEQEVAAFIAQSGNKILYFGANWCEPCRRMNSSLTGPNNLVNYLKEKQFTVAKVDVDVMPEVARSHGHRQIPTLEVYSGEKRAGYFTGSLNSHQIAEKVKYHADRF